MSVIATALKHLMAAGVAGDALVEAVAEMELALQPKRSPGADRTARWRAKRHGDVTSVTGDGDPSPPLPPFPPAPPNPPISPPTDQKTSRAKTATELSDDWEPDGRTWKLADELGFTAREASDQLDRMRDWARNAGAKGRKTDWNAAFRNWLKRAADDRRNKPQAAVQRNSLADSFAILDAVTDEAIRRSDGRREEGGEENPFEFPGLRESAA